MLAGGLEPVRLADVEAARVRIAGIAIRTPLVRLNGGPAEPTILLKLENLQPIGAFKIRGAANAMLSLAPEDLSNGVYTASAGNMAQGVAWVARRLGVPCRVVVPTTAPRAKTDVVERLGGEVLRVPVDEWWATMRNHGHPDLDGRFIHPFADSDVMAGNGTIGLEILEDAPDVDAIVVPYGGGGLSSGIAAAAAAVKPGVRVYAAEVDSAAPFAASLAAGHPTSVETTASFVDGIGSKGVFEQMWPLASRLLAGSLVASVAEVADAVRLLAARNRVVAEGAGAASVAAAINRPIPARTMACVVSGGNIDLDVLAAILRGETPAGTTH
jgi:threonine dehydratase